MATNVARCRVFVLFSFLALIYFIDRFVLSVSTIAIFYTKYAFKNSERNFIDIDQRQLIVLVNSQAEYDSLGAHFMVI